MEITNGVARREAEQRTAKERKKERASQLCRAQGDVQVMPIFI